MSAKQTALRTLAVAALACFVIAIPADAFLAAGRGRHTGLVDDGRRILFTTYCFYREYGAPSTEASSSPSSRTAQDYARSPA